jgi:ribosomal protein S6--L-glutamate ligase
MNGCILGPMKRSESELWLLKEGKKIFDKFPYIPIPDVRIEMKDGQVKVLYKRMNLEEFDCIIPRVPRTYTWIGYTILNVLKDKVYMPIKPESVFTARNKFITLLTLKDAGLPVPNSYLTITRANMDELLDKMSYPVVMKLLYGSLGKGVMFADSKQSAASLMDTLERFKEPIFLEEYIRNPGEDIRAFVLGDSILASMKRKAKRDEMRANIAIGGSGEPIELGPKIKELAVRAAKVLGMGICGIDIIEGIDGPQIIEANVNVHFEGLTKTTGINVAKKVVEWVKKEAKVMEWLRR